MQSPPPDTPQQAPKQVRNLVHSLLSFDSNIMLAAIISLLVVILFVLLLHVYAKWFLVQAARQGSRRAVSVPQVLGAHFHHLHTFAVDTTFASSPTKGLEPSAISSIPLFVYKTDELKHGLECVICLSVFENEEMGRKLSKCNHAFHVECIDMWLHSHTTCPICRAPVVCDSNGVDTTSLSNDEITIVRDLDSPEIAADELCRCNNEDSALEIIVEVPSCSDNENIVTNDSSSVCSSSSSSSSSSSQAVPSLLGASLKRMMSRSRCERKVHPSGNVIESDVSERE